MSKSSIDAAVVAIVKRALSKGYFQHIIAGYFLINQGRVSEIKNGKRWSEVTPADCLPDDFPARA